MSKVGDVVKEEVPVTCVGGSRQSTPPGYKDTLKPPTLRDSNVDELASKLKVLKLQEKIAKLKKKLKSRKKRFKKCLPLHPEMKTAMSPPSTRVSMSRKTKAKRKNGAKPSYNPASFNYDSLPSNHSFTSVHISKPPRFDGMNYAKWCHATKVHLMSLNPSIWKVVCIGVEFLEDNKTPHYNQLQQIHYNTQATNVLLSYL
jgi:hypothetical protein